MMITAASHSIFSPLVAGSGSIIAMSTALLLGWKGREKWEPSDQDIDKGAQKVGALAAGILIAFMFIELSKPDAVPILMRISLQSLVVTVASLLVYGSLTTIFVYVQWQGTPQQRNIVGGIVLKSEARNALAREKRLAMERGETPPTVQELFMGAAYVIDQL